MPKKNIIIIVIVAILVLLGVIFISFGREKAEVKKPDLPETQEIEEVPAPDIEAAEQEQADIDVVSALKSRLTVQARAFIERYGTYSLDSGFQNLAELLSQASENLAQEMSAKIEQGLDQTQEFFALVTKVGSIELTELDQDLKAVFTADVQQQDMRKGETSILYKTAELIMIKSGDEWLVDSISFQLNK